MHESERNARVELAACYRIVANHGWDDSVFTHISVRVPGTEHFLLNPFGLFFEEITASSLVKVDHAGRTVDDATAAINPAGFIIHSAVHAFRPEAACVIHLHTIVAWPSPRSPTASCPSARMPSASTARSRTTTTRASCSRTPSVSACARIWVRATS